MDRVATDVAKPPIPGGDLPSFEELLAKGSFHARLAQARAARERALAESGSADGFILNTSRKPWERDDDTPKADDRLVTALEATVAPSNVTRLHADAAPADLGRTGAERLPGETVASQQRRCGGFTSFRRRPRLRPRFRQAIRSRRGAGSP